MAYTGLGAGYTVSDKTNNHWQQRSIVDSRAFGGQAGIMSNTTIFEMMGSKLVAANGNPLPALKFGFDAAGTQLRFASEGAVGGLLDPNLRLVGTDWDRIMNNPIVPGPETGAELIADEMGPDAAASFTNLPKGVQTTMVFQVQMNKANRVNKFMTDAIQTLHSMDMEVIRNIGKLA